MKVRDLIESLQNEDPDAEVRIMEQPSWPFENAIAGIWNADATDSCPRCGEAPDHATHDLGNEDTYDHESEGFKPSDNFTDTHEGPVVYIVEGGQEGYGSADAFANAY